MNTRGSGLRLAVSFAEQAVAAEVAILEPALEARVGDAQLGLELDQLGRLLVGVVVHPADLLGQDQDAAVGVDDFRLEIGVFQVGAVGDGAVVGQQDRLGVLDVRQHGVGKRLAARRLVGRDRDLAQEHLDFGQDALGDRLAGDGEGRRVRRMTVHDRAHVGPRLHDRQVQQDLARALALAGDLLAVQVDDAQIVGLHESLRHPRRRAEHPVVAEPQADVAVVGRGESLVVDPPADLAHLLAKLPLVHHCSVAAHVFLAIVLCIEFGLIPFGD